MAASVTRRLTRPALFVCDIQERFRTAIWQCDRVLLTTQKVLKAASILSIPVYVTTQIRSKLGDTCSELEIGKTFKPVENVDKTAFSMWIPEISRHFQDTKSEIAIVGIESHICVTQTTLDALRAGHKVYVLVDGVSSCNKEEVGIALDRLRKEGAIVTTSESWIYEVMGDAGIEEFRKIAGLVKEETTRTKETLNALLSSKI